MQQPPPAIGRYRVERALGSGGMSKLYLATDPALGRELVIKVLGEPDSGELRERFLREARSIARLTHPNIVGIYDLGEFENGLFIAMEYVKGPTLAEVIATRARLPLARKLEIVREVCDGLGYAHRAGIVHRDVKPANVVLGEDGAIKILDFGIARLNDEGARTQAGTVLGTPNYMAPEQVRGESVGPQTDVYGTGVLLYELLALRQPFQADGLPAVMFKIVNGELEPLDRVVPALPADVVGIVNQATARERDRRYQDIADMGRDLERVRRTLAPDFEAIPAESPPPSARSDRTVLMPPPQAPASPGRAIDPGGHTVILPPPPAARADRVNVMPAVQVVVVRSGDARRRGRTVVMDGPNLTIGRARSCTLQLDDPMLSREHAAIDFGPSGFTIRELASTNGTFVNGRRIKPGAPEPLFFGATIEIGDTVLAFTLAAEVKLPDLTGTRLASRYELRRLIRDSAKGSVYVGVDTRMAKEVAVKLMSPELMRLEAYREQFEREAAIGATLHHPHICQVLDRGEDDVRGPDGSTLSLRFLCLELMGGGSLQHRLRKGVVPLDEALRIIDCVADALDYAHRHDVVHGDVKPGAVVFSVDGHVYLTDFAFAQRALHEADGPTLGTPAYVAPEVWDHGQITPATDQFAFAVVVYHLLGGTLPFAGQENPAVRRKNLLQGPVPLHQEAAGYRPEPLPKAVSETVARALAAEPARRFGSVTAFAAALAAAMKGRRLDRGAPQVFFSYRRDGGSGWANYFAKELKEHGIATFVDVQRVDRAQQFPERLSRAIEECDVFVCLLGETTLQSPWVLEEIRQAHRHGKPMIPIFQETFDPATRAAGDAAIDALLSFDAVHLFDVRNVHVQHSAGDLATLVKNTVARL